MMTILNPAIEATIETGDPVIIFGVGLVAGQMAQFMVIHGDGQVTMESISRIRMNWRYDVEQDRWLNSDGSPVDEE